MPAVKRLAMLVCAVAVFVLPATANAAITTVTKEYGPYTIPAGGGDPHNHGTMGAIANKIVTNISKPCTGCTLIGATPDLVYENGTKANITDGPMLHHAVFMAQSSGKVDATCGTSGPGALGERFFATGNERTAIDLQPLNYGYKVNSTETWNMVIDLMNWATTSKTVKVKVTWKYATGTDHTNRGALRPVWLDADGCSMDSYISVPFGVSDTHWDWNATFGGNMIAAAGHIHDHGEKVEVTNKSASEAMLCTSTAGTGGTGYVTHLDGRKHVSSMSVCTGNPLGTIKKGDTLRLHGTYNVPEGHHAIEDAMIIAIAYINPS
jgi:hypothetical protein